MASAMSLEIQKLQPGPAGAFSNYNQDENKQFVATLRNLCKDAVKPRLSRAKPCSQQSFSRKEIAAMPPKTILKSINVVEFEALASHTRLTEGPKAMARMVLVDGKSGSEVAALFNVSKQRVSLAVGSIRKAHEANAMLIGMPDSMTNHLQAFLTALRASDSSAVQEVAIAQINRALVRATDFIALSTSE